MVETDSEQIKECGDGFMWGIKGEGGSLHCKKGVLDRVALKRIAAFEESPEGGGR